ncbi:MAG: PaaI family thioesterase [Flavobacteriaceae bacterium]
MSEFKPRSADYATRVLASFAKQAFMTHIGAKIVHVAPGEVDVDLPARDDLNQQHGFFHAGTTSAIADSAAGYAAFSLFPADRGVLTTEYKINLLNPGRGERLIARGRVMKPGRTLTVCRSDVFGITGGEETIVATGLFTMMAVEGFTN